MRQQLLSGDLRACASKLTTAILSGPGSCWINGEEAWPAGSFCLTPCPKGRAFTPCWSGRAQRASQTNQEAKGEHQWCFCWQPRPAQNVWTWAITSSQPSLQQALAKRGATWKPLAKKRAIWAQFLAKRKEKHFGQTHCRAKFPEKKIGAAGYKDKPNKGAESQPEEGCWLCCCHEKACQEKAKAKSKAKSKKPLPKEIASTTTYPRKKRTKPGWPKAARSHLGHTSQAQQTQVAREGFPWLWEPQEPP